MPPTTYLQIILQSFAAMAIEGLWLILKDEYTYEDTTKKIFLNEIECIFKAHRNCGDTELLLYEGACCSKTCENCGKKGYRLVGNFSKNYIDLIFEMDGDDITDIYTCSEFKSHTEIPDLESKANIYINLDDEVGFPKPPEYWTRVYAACDAYNELITTPPRKLDFEEMTYWLDKHSDLYQRSGGFGFLKPHLKWTTFLMLYADLQEMKQLISENLDQIRQANRELKQIETEQEIIEWLLRYEEIHKKGTVDLMFTVVKVGKEYYFDKTNLYQFKGEIFNETLGFFESYQTHHEPLLEKYTIYTPDEEAKMYNEENYKEEKPDLYSLKFHLESRKELEELGVNLPFYLRDKDKSDEEIPF